MPDIIVKDEGSVVLMDGTSDAGRHWLEQNIDPDATRWGSAIVLEHRYAPAILYGARVAGLKVEVTL